MERLAPEDLPALVYPEYFNDLDKAKFQVETGRYRLALVTLGKAKDADVVEAAITRAKAQATLGRSTAALETLSQAKVSADPRAAILRAQILASIGKTDEALSLLKAQVDAHPDSLAAHFELGKVQEQVGDLDGARKSYSWFVDDSRLLDKWQGNTGESVFDDAGVGCHARAGDRSMGESDERVQRQSGATQCASEHVREGV